MTTTDKLLRVQVAEAMGHKCHLDKLHQRWLWYGTEASYLLPDYGGPDWTATGEMLEWLDTKEWNVILTSALRSLLGARRYECMIQPGGHVYYGDTPHEAVARCVLAVAQGK
jgi:hypothetical protein